jgi:hypothetical protein
LLPLTKLKTIISSEDFFVTVHSSIYVGAITNSALADRSGDHIFFGKISDGKTDIRGIVLGKQAKTNGVFIAKRLQREINFPTHLHKRLSFSTNNDNIISEKNLFFLNPKFEGQWPKIYIEDVHLNPGANWNCNNPKYWHCWFIHFVIVEKYTGPDRYRGKDLVILPNGNVWKLPIRVSEPFDGENAIEVGRFKIEDGDFHYNFKRFAFPDDFSVAEGGQGYTWGNLGDFDKEETAYDLIDSQFTHILTATSGNIEIEFKVYIKDEFLLGVCD